MICFSPMLFFILFQFSLESAILFFEITILVSFCAWTQKEKAKKIRKKRKDFI
jgi:hypothetical protein